MSSQAVRVLNSAHLSIDPCTHLHPNCGDNSSDPSRVSMRPTEDKNSQDYTQGDYQGTPRLGRRETGSWEKGVGAEWKWNGLLK